MKKEKAYFKVKHYVDFPDGTVLVKDELLTPLIVAKKKFPLHWFDLVTVNPDTIYYFFGARFSDEFYNP